MMHRTARIYVSGLLPNSFVTNKYITSPNIVSTPKLILIIGMLKLYNQSLAGLIKPVNKMSPTKIPIPSKSNNVFTGLLMNFLMRTTS